MVVQEVERQAAALGCRHRAAFGTLQQIQLTEREARSQQLALQVESARLQQTIALYKLDLVHGQQRTELIDWQAWEADAHIKGLLHRALASRDTRNQPPDLSGTF